MKRENYDYFDDEEFREILEQYEQASEQGMPVYMDADDLTDIAEYYMTRNEEAKADECIALATSLHPDATSPQVFIARQHLFHDNIQEAYRIYHRIDDQESREVIFLHGELLLKEGKVDEACRVLKNEYVNMDEDTDLYLYDVADLLYEYGFYEASRTWTEHLQRDFPDYHEAKLLMGDILMKQCEYEGAQKQAEAMLETDTFHQNAWMLLAEALMMQDKYEEALEAADYLLAINEQHQEAMLTRASALFYLTRFMESHEQYAAYEKLYPGEATVKYLDGMCLANLDLFEEAKQTFLSAIELAQPTSNELVHMHIQLAHVLSKLKEVDEALTQVDVAQLCLTQPDSPLDFNLIRGHICLENEMYDRAETFFETAVESSKQPYETIFLVGLTAGETGYFNKSVQIFEMLYDSCMEAAHKRTSPYLAYCHLVLEHREKFLSYLKEAVEENPTLTQQIFSHVYPDTPVTEYYEKARREMKNNAD